MSARSLALVAATLCLATAAPVAGQSAPALTLTRLGPITFDGRVDAAEWDGIAPLPMTMYSPLYRGTPTEETEIRLAYDDAFLYASGRFFDSDPSGIRVNSLYRDRWSGDDVFALFVDSFNDNQSSRRFTVTPAGTRIDELIGADGSERNLSWDAPWDVVTSRDARGWYFEMRIPFSSLRFQATGAEVAMGITVTRYIARKNERVTFPDIDPRFRFDQPSRTQDVVLHDIAPARPAYVTPYVLSGVAGQRAPGTPAAGLATDGLFEGGLDLKYSVTDNIFADVSVNTDFAQVEADDQQINLTRFPLFFPEKRQFFQERSDLFLFDFASGGRLFHSRNIGLAADRTPVRLLGGARIAGRSGGWDFGALSMQADAHGTAPGENFGVLRLRRRVLNPYSYAGAMATTRFTNDGKRALAGGLDASLRVFGNHYATARWAVTDADGEEASVSEASQVYLEWARRVDQGLRYWVRFNRAGSDYAPSQGFLPRRDFYHTSLYAIHSSRGKAGQLLRSWGPGAIVNAFFANADGALETLYAAHWWNYEFWDGASGWLQVTHRRELVETPFGLGDGVTVPVGEHRFTNLWFYLGTGPTRNVRTDFSARVGSFYDGRQVELSIRPTMNLSRHLELGAEYEGNLLRFSNRNQAVDIHLMRLRARAALDVRLSATALVQYNSVTDQLGMNFRVRYNLREGADLWLVYDEARLTDDVPGAVSLPRGVQARSLRVKGTYAFAL